MDKVPLRLLLFLIIVHLLILQSGLAHQDDSGEVHPNVYLENGKIAVYFKDNVARKYLRSQYSIEGKLKNTKEVNEQNHAKQFEYHGTWEQAIPSKEHLALYKNFGQLYTHACSENKELQAMLFSHLDEKKSGEPTVSSKFSLFDKNKGKAIYVQKLKSPATVWSTPQVSNIEFSKNTSYFTWMRERFDAKAKKVVDYDLVLTKVDINGTQKTETVCKGNWNSAPSIRILGNRLFIAYHSAPRYDDDRDEIQQSKVKVVSVDLRNQ